jgi:hypothetical protein
MADPYEVTSIDLGGGFRFSSQFLSDSNKLKTFVYQQSKGRYVLIHAGEYRVAEGLCDQDEDMPGWGLNRVYSAQLERELTFQCKLVCNQ